MAASVSNLNPLQQAIYDSVRDCLDNATDRGIITVLTPDVVGDYDIEVTDEDGRIWAWGIFDNQIYAQERIYFDGEYIDDGEEADMTAVNEALKAAGIRIYNEYDPDAYINDCDDARSLYDF